MGNRLVIIAGTLAVLLAGYAVWRTMTPDRPAAATPQTERPAKPKPAARQRAEPAQVAPARQELAPARPASTPAAAPAPIRPTAPARGEPAADGDGDLQEALRKFEAREEPTLEEAAELLEKAGQAGPQ